MRRFYEHKKIPHFAEQTLLVMMDTRNPADFLNQGDHDGQPTHEQLLLLVGDDRYLALSHLVANTLQNQVHTYHQSQYEDIYFRLFTYLGEICNTPSPSVRDIPRWVFSSLRNRLPRLIGESRAAESFENLFFDPTGRRRKVKQFNHPPGMLSGESRLTHLPDRFPPMDLRVWRKAYRDLLAGLPEPLRDVVRARCDDNPGLTRRWVVDVAEELQLTHDQVVDLLNAAAEAWFGPFNQKRAAQKQRLAKWSIDRTGGKP